MLPFEGDLGMEKFLFGLIVAGILPVLAQAADMEDVARPWRDYWNAHRAQCEADIEVVRKSNGRIVITDGKADNIEFTTPSTDTGDIVYPPDATEISDGLGKLLKVGRK